MVKKFLRGFSEEGDKMMMNSQEWQGKFQSSLNKILRQFFYSRWFCVYVMTVY